jgi:hypothetical protein
VPSGSALSSAKLHRSSVHENENFALGAAFFLPPPPLQPAASRTAMQDAKSLRFITYPRPVFALGAR